MRQSTMRVKLLLFGQLRESGGAAEEWRQVRAGGSVAELVAELQTQGGLDEKLLSTCALAVNQEYVRGDWVLSEGDEVALLPPVSGGAA